MEDLDELAFLLRVHIGPYLGRLPWIVGLQEDRLRFLGRLKGGFGSKLFGDWHLIRLDGLLDFF